MKNFKDLDNSDMLTFYIILRNDLDRELTLQMTDIVSITNVIQEDLREKANKSEYYRDVYYKFINLETNTIILQASGVDLFEDNYIPCKYEDPDIIFDYIWDNEERVAHSNFRLKEGSITCLGYFGKKKDMPKFVRKLKLYKGK